MNDKIRDILACPRCISPLGFRGGQACCLKCGSSFRVTDEAIYFCEPKRETEFEEIGYAKDKTRWSAFKKRNFAFVEKEVSNLPRQSVIVDVGAGPGVFHELFARFGNYLSMDFIDYPGIDVVTDIVSSNLPIQSSSVDVVIICNVLEHLNEPEQTLAECYRILNRGGRLVGVVPFMFKLHQEPYDFCRYTHYKLREIMEDCHFRDVVIEKMGTILDVLEGVKYEVKKLMLTCNRNRFLLRQFFRLQYHLDTLVERLFLKMNEKTLTEQELFVGYSFTATKE